MSESKRTKGERGSNKAADNAKRSGAKAGRKAARVNAGSSAAAKDDRQGILDVDKLIEDIKNNEEDVLEAMQTNMAWIHLWSKTIARAWRAMKAPPGTPEHEWLYKKLLSNDHELVALAIKEQSTDAHLPDKFKLQIRVRLDEAVTWQRADGSFEEATMDPNELTLILPSPPEAEVQAQALSHYQSSGRIYPFTTF